MKTRLLIFSIFLFLTGFLKAQAPPWVWAQEANSSGEEYAWDVICDTASNSVYIGGTFDGNISAKYGSAFTASYGQDDGFLAKYTNDGVFQWALKIGGTANDQVKSVAVDPSGNVYVCGYFTGTADFDPSGATFNLTASAGKDGFLAKYSSAGVFLWAVKYGAGGDDEPWKMYADANGIYLTGSYTNAPVTFYSYSSGVTKVTTSGNSTGEVFGAKYNAAGVAQWVISGGGAKIDCGYSVVADANNAYFIGRYDEDITFRNSSGAASAVLQHQQSNKQQVFIIAYSQAAGAFMWQTNITCSQGGDDVVGWTIAQDASNLYVSGYLEGDINFKYPSPTLTQSHTGGGSFDIFLAKLSKTGTFLWRAPVTGSGSGEQVGRALDVDHNGNVILTGHFMSNLNYSAAGGPVLTASAKDIFVTSYSNSGAFQWAAKAGNTGDDFVNGLAVDNAGGIYVAGSHDNGAVFGTYSLTAGGGVNNIYVAKIGCNALGNNTISASQTICSGNTPSSLTGSLPTGSGPYTYVWEKSPDNLSWANATGTYTNQNYAPSSLTVTTYYRRKVIVTGTCAATLTSTSILISVDAMPTPANAGTSQTLCTSSATLSANTPAAGTGLWSVITGTGSVTTFSNASSPVTGLSYGINQFVWTVSNGVCPSSSSTVTVNRDVPPTISNAGVSQTLCTSSATLNANTPATGTGLWSVATGTGTVTAPGSNTSGITGLSNGTNQFIWTISNGTCPSSSSTVTINRDVPPTVSNAGISQTLCTSSATLNANAPTTGTGLWSVATGTGTVTAPGSNTSGITGLSNGANQFVWTISNGTCPSSSSTVTINRDVPPTISNAGVSQTLCTSSASLNGNAPTTGTGVWSVITGTGTVTSPGSNTSGITGLSNGTNQFVWTISNGTCPSSSSTVTINRDVPPTVSNAGVSQTLCTSSATLNANAPTTGTGLWTVATGTGTVTAPGSNTSGITGLSNGTNQFIWTISNGVCPSSSSTVTINRDVPPTTSNAGISQTLCTSSATLNANVPTTGTGLWTVATGTGTVTAPGSNTSGITGLSNGTNQFVWTISNSTCPSSSSTVTVNKDVPPTISNAGISQTLCTSSATLNANAPTTGTGLWSVATGTGTVTAPGSNTSGITGLSNGTNQFIWTISNGVCPSSSSTVTINRDVPPTTSNAGASQTLCTSSATLNANTPTTGTGLWSVATGTGSVMSGNNPLSPVTGLSNGANQFVWTISNGTCPSSSSTVTVNRDIPPTVSNAGTSQTICASSATLAANVPTIGTGTWSVITGTGSITNSSNPSTTVTGLSNAVNDFVWTISNGTCPSSSSTITVTRDEMPTVSNAGTSQTLCTTTATLNANSPTIGSGLWSVVSGSGVITSSANPLSVISNLSDGSNDMVWTITNGVCPSSSSTVTIIKDVMPSVSNAGASQTVCASSASLSANIPATGTGLWTILTGTSSVTSTGDPLTTINGLSNGANDLVWTISNGTCPSSSSTVTVTRDEMPTVSSAGTSQTLCVTSVTLNANNPIIGSGLWSVLSGSGTITSLNDPLSSITNLSDGNNDLAWTITNGVCPSSSSTVTITKDVVPSVSNAGTSQTVCVSSVALAANTPTTGTGVWSVITGTGSVVNSNNPSTSITGLSNGANDLVWTISNGTCPSSSSTVTITRDLEPTVSNAGTSQTLCVTTATLNANMPVIGTGTWTVISGSGTIISANDPSSAVSGLTDGVNNFVWTISNGVCPSSSSTVIITKDVSPSAPDAGSDQTICSSTVSLNAGVPVTGTAMWTVLSGSGTLVNATMPSSPVTGLSIGNNQFVWTISNGVCPALSDTVSVFQDEMPSTALAGTDKIICSSSDNLSANLPLIGSGLWTVSSGNGTISNPGSQNSPVSNLSVGVNSFIWTISSGVCPASRDTLIITIDTNPTTPDAGSDRTICSGNFSLQGNVALTGTGNWTLISGAGTFQNPALNNTTVSSLGMGINIFRWTIQNGVCPVVFDEVTVIQDVPPSVASAGNDIETDYRVADLVAVVPLVGTGSWSVIEGPAEINDVFAPAAAATNLGIGSNIFRWTVRNGVCPESTDDILVELNPLKIPNAFSPNDDGINEAFVIPGLEYYNNVKFSVFNRWSALLYENTNYKNEWTGLNGSKEKLADDTYYYTLELPSIDKKYTGFIIIKTSK